MAICASKKTWPSGPPHIRPNPIAERHHPTPRQRLASCLQRQRLPFVPRRTGKRYPPAQPAQSPLPVEAPVRDHHRLHPQSKAARKLRRRPFLSKSPENMAPRAGSTQPRLLKEVRERGLPHLVRRTGFSRHSRRSRLSKSEVASARTRCAMAPTRRSWRRAQGARRRRSPPCHAARRVEHALREAELVHRRRRSADRSRGRRPKATRRSTTLSTASSTPGRKPAALLRRACTRRSSCARRPTAPPRGARSTSAWTHFSLDSSSPGRRPSSAPKNVRDARTDRHRSGPGHGRRSAGDVGARRHPLGALQHSATSPSPKQTRRAGGVHHVAERLPFAHKRVDAQVETEMDPGFQAGRHSARPRSQSRGASRRRRRRSFQRNRA